MGEILYEYNAGSIDQTIDWKNMSKLSFKKKEALLRRMIILFGIVWVFVIFAL